VTLALEMASLREPEPLSLALLTVKTAAATGEALAAKTDSPKAAHNCFRSRANATQFLPVMTMI
jgi:hypothetical protein